MRLANRRTTPPHQEVGKSTIYDETDSYQSRNRTTAEQQAHFETLGEFCRRGHVPAPYHPGPLRTTVWQSTCSLAWQQADRN